MIRRLCPLAEVVVVSSAAVTRRVQCLGPWGTSALFVVLTFAIGSALATAQIAPGDGNSPSKAESGSLLDRIPSDVIYVLDEKGVPVPVKAGATLEQFYEFVRQSQSKLEALPAPSVASVTLTGTADDERAVLAATFVIQNEHTDDFVTVPLALHEAVIRHFQHEGPGEFRFQANDRSQGSTWWIRGAGRHTVTIELSVPVKRQGSSRRLQLTLPDTAISKIDLATIFRGVTAKSAVGESQVINRENETSRIEVLGFGTKLDLTWQPVVAESVVAPVLEADTTIMAHASTEAMLIEAYQRLSVLQGSVSEIAVRLPPQAELLSIEGRDYRAHRKVADDPSRVLVQLASPGNGQIQLKWTIRLPAVEERKFVLEGFQVEQARKQSGQIGLIPVEGLRMDVSNTDHPHLMRIDAVELRPLSGQVSRAYRYFSQPFRMVLTAVTIEPYFTVEPEFTLSVRQDEAILEGVFAINVLRGDLRELELDWPNWKADGWTLDSVEPQGEVLAGVDQDWENLPQRMRLRLVEDLNDQFAVRLKARRVLRPGEAVPVPMPRLVARDSVSVPLRLIEADNLSCELTPIGETVLDVRPAAHDALWQASDQPGRIRTYRIAAGEQHFSLRAVKQDRRILVASATSLEFVGSRLRCVQNFQFEVEHERLAEFQVSAPTALRPSVRFQLDGDRVLQASWQDGLENDDSIATITFPEPRLGQFTVQAEFDLPLSDEILAGEAGVEIPILACIGHEFQRIDLLAAQEFASVVSVADSSWKPRSEGPGRATWTASGPARAVRIWFESGGGSQAPLITATELSCEWERQGTVHCSARYRMSGWFMRLGVVLPADAVSVQATWDDRPLSEPKDIAPDSSPRHYSLRVRASGSDGEEHWLTIQYRLPSRHPFGLWNRWPLAAPQITHAKWMSDSRWELRFPSDQHLFNFPDAFTPEFQWQRRGLIWKRVSPPIAKTAATHVPVNGYVFRQFGEPQAMQVATMSGPMILFIGASTSLAIGFLLLRVPRLRSLLSAWIAVLLVTVAGLWFRHQLEVLLQPILMGMVFPLAAVWLQGRRRRDASAVLSFDPLLELSEPHSSVVTGRYVPESPGQEPVLVRSPSGSTHDFLRTGAGSGVS